MDRNEPSDKFSLTSQNNGTDTSLQIDHLLNVFHELKTPLSVILGAIKLIEMEQVNLSNTHIPKNTRLIKVNCYRLLRLMNNILDLTKLEYNYDSLNLVNCNLVNITEDMINSIIPIAEARNISIEFCSSHTQIITAIDIDKFERIILNLLSNAIKFTDEYGYISVHIEDIKNKVFIHVKDNGIGIPKSKHKMVFARYKQYNGLLSKGNEGTGIGLALVKYFVEMHKGKITLNSDEGKGSEFIVELPITGTTNKIQESPKSVDNYEKIIRAINIELSDIYTSS